VTTPGAPRRHEAIAALLLALAAVTTAWCSLQATHWHGEQARSAARSNALRIQVVSAQGLADSQQQVDIATFIQWVNAYNAGDAKLADFYRRRFRPEFEPAFAAWLATKPLKTAGAPPTPFAMKEYVLQARQDAARLDATSAAAASRAGRCIQRAESYVLAVVLLSLTLFFAATGSRFGSTRVRTVMVGIAGLLFLGTVIWIATLPKGISV
jgi:hypothetical protein